MDKKTLINSKQCKSSLEKWYSQQLKGYLIFHFYLKLPILDDNRLFYWYQLQLSKITSPYLEGGLEIYDTKPRRAHLGDIVVRGP